MGGAVQESDVVSETLQNLKTLRNTKKMVIIKWRFYAIYANDAKKNVRCHRDVSLLNLSHASAVKRV